MSMLRTLVLTTGAALCLAAFAGPGFAQTPKRGGTVLFATENEPPNLDCHGSQSVAALYFVAPIYSLLVRYDQKNYPNIIGDLAESWTVSPDGQTYTFKLRQNVKFHDGTPFTSADVKATFDRLRNPPQGVVSLRKEEFADITAIDTPDPQTAIFRLSQRNAALMSTLANPFNCVYAAKVLAQSATAPQQTAMGTGAFMQGEWVRGASWTGKRFDGYFRPGLPYLDTYKYAVMSTNAPINATAAGQIDGLLRILSPQEVSTIVAGRGDKAVVKGSVVNVLTHITFNVSRKPFDDVRVRRALTLAIDRKAGLDPIMKITNMAAAGGLLIPGYPMALPDAELAKQPGFGPNVEASRAEARRLLAEAGQSNLKFKLLTRTQANPWLNLGLFAIDEWRKIGLTIETNALEQSAAFFAGLANSDFDVSVDSNSTTSDDPTLVLAKFIPGNPSNYGKANDATLGDLYRRQKVAASDAERKALVEDFQRRVLDQAYIAPLFWAGWTLPLPKDLHGFQPLPSYYLGYDLTEAWRD